MSFPEVSGRTRRRLVWLVPVIVSGVVVLIAAMTGPSSASTPNLAPLSAKKLIVAVERSTTTAFSGTVQETTSLGLPSLPGDAQQASLSWQTFLTGTHSIRVWADGPERQRLALVGELSEAEVVHDGRDVWTYTSHTNSASHTVLPARDRSARRSDAEPVEPTPSALADRVRKAVTPTTRVRVTTAQTVAGRAAYVLSISPRDARSTVRKATIAIDARRFVPLRVQVFGRGSSPALSIGFSKISFARPAASVFTFRIPKGATLETDPLNGSDHHRWGHRHEDGSRPSAGTAAHAAKPQVIGTGWTSVLELHGTVGLGSGMLKDATTSIGGGARLLHTALVNAVFLPDGRTFVGAVTPAALEHVAATTAR